MSFEFYKLLHLTGLFSFFASTGGQLVHFMNGGAKQHPAKRFLAIGHGVGLLLALIGGFGMLGVMNIGFPPWSHGKIALWVLAGGISGLIVRFPQKAKIFWSLLMLVGIAGAYLALYKPFM